MQTLTESQTKMMRRLYSLAPTLELDEVSADYVRVIMTCLNTIDDLRVALKIERKEGEFAPRKPLGSSDKPAHQATVLP